MTNKQTQKRSIEMAATSSGLRRIVQGGILLNVILGFTYLMMLNSLATQGFDLENLKTEKMQIQKQMEEIDIALAIPTSLYALESSEQVQNMARVRSRNFLEVVDDGTLTMLGEERKNLQNHKRGGLN